MIHRRLKKNLIQRKNIAEFFFLRRHLLLMPIASDKCLTVVNTKMTDDLRWTILLFLYLIKSKCFFLITISWTNAIGGQSKTKKKTASIQLNVWTVRTDRRQHNRCDVIKTESIVFNSLQLKRFLVSHSRVHWYHVRVDAFQSEFHTMPCGRMPRGYNNNFASQHPDAYFVVDQVKKNIWCRERMIITCKPT